ncbi:MAG: antitoxin component YwqK of YwqJK toxin-antitoxin module, partial [Crocinitomicaceae bacterium]
FGEERNRGTWTEVEYMDACSFRSGVWEYYHSNGKLQMIGEYSKMIHACYGTSITDFDQTSEYLKENGIVLSDSGIINGWVRYENLKDGVWFYFDENGKKIKEEEFIDGDLIYLKE